ncbi:MAG: hypothetical protein GX555_18275 [Actinomycetales bacterium]|nr:hypothetical protein [Actinomycetales bacterium]
MGGWIRSARVLVGLALVALVVGGAVLGASLAAHQSARGDLNMLRAANANLEMTVQARIDEVRGQRSLSLTSADDDALAEKVDVLRKLAPDTAGPGLEEVLALDAAFGTPDEPSAPLMGMGLALDSLTWDTTLPVVDRIEAAQARVWWSFWVTGSAVVLLLVAALARLRPTES